MMRQNCAFLDRVLGFVLVALSLIGYAYPAHAERSAAGTEFIFPVTPKAMALSATSFQVLLTSEEPTVATVSVPGLGFSRQVAVVPGGATRVTLPLKTFLDLVHDAVINRSVRVTSSHPVRVSVELFSRHNSDAFLALPVEGLGKRYRAVSYIARFKASLTVTAVEDNTHVTITPSDDTPGRPAGAPFVVTLNRYESYHLGHGSPMYHVDGDQLTDVTGTLIESDKPVAVSSGNACTNVPYRVSSCDHLSEMMPPVEAWGRRIMTVPLAGRLGGDLIRVVADEDDTVVLRNGQEHVQLSAGEYFDAIVTDVSLFEANKPILIMQYSTGESFDRTISDPFMMTAVPAEQYLKAYTVSTAQKGFPANYLSLIVPAAAADSLRLNGQRLQNASFEPVPGSTYLAVRVPVSIGSHQVSADQPFGLYIYGYADADSYGYPGGMGLEPINVTEGDFAEVELRIKLPRQGVALMQDTFSEDPHQQVEGAEGGELVWRWDALSVGDERRLTFDLHMPGPLPDEQRVVLEDVQLEYLDLAGNEHHRNLGQQTVAVLHSWLDSYLSVSSASVKRGEFITLTAGLESLGETVNTASWQLRVEDAEGGVVAVLESGQSLLAGGSVEHMAEQSYSTAGLYEGTYSAVLVAHDDAGGILTYSESPFTVTVAPEASALEGHLAVSQADYQPGDTLRMRVDLANTAVGRMLDDLVVSLDVAGAEHSSWSTEYVVRQLVPGVKESRRFEVLLDDWAPGNYTATLVVRDKAGNVLYTEENELWVESSAESGYGVTGSLTLSTSSMLRTESLGLVAEVSNKGNAALESLPLRLRILDPASGTIIAEFTEMLTTLAEGQRHLFEASWLSNVATPGNYVASLSGNFPDGERPLAYEAFEVKERFKLHMAFAAPRSVLVLMDPAECDTSSLQARVTLPALLVDGDVLDVALTDGEGALLDSERYQMGIDPLPINTAPGAAVDMSITQVFPEAMVLQLTETDVVTTGRLQVTLQREGRSTEFLSETFSYDCDAVRSGSSLFQFEPFLENGQIALARERSVLQRTLDRKEWHYRIVTTAEDFESELATGRYPTVALLGSRVKLSEPLQHELVDKVSNGLGLLVAGSHDMRNGRLTKALGVKIRGKLPHATGWSWADGWLPQGEHVFEDAVAPLRVESLTAEVQAIFTQPDTGTSPPAVTEHSFGEGKSVFMAMDVLGELLLEEEEAEQGRTAATWLLTGLEKVSPASSEPVPGSLRRVDFSVWDRGAGGPLLLSLPLPESYTLIAPGNGRASGDALFWPRELPPGGLVAGSFLVTLPNEPQLTVWQPEISLLSSDRGWTDYVGLRFFLNVTDDRVTP